MYPVVFVADHTQMVWTQALITKQYGQKTQTLCLHYLPEMIAEGNELVYNVYANLWAPEQGNAETTLN